MCNASNTEASLLQKVPAENENGAQEGANSEGAALWARLTVPSRIKAINPAVKRLMTMLRTTCLAPGQAFAIETALREALANAIVHGNRLNRAKKVRVCCGCDTRGIHIVIADEGDGFDPVTLPSPLAGHSLDSDHGRGIFLIRAHMDEVRFEKGGREIHMRKKRPTCLSKRENDSYHA